MRMHRVIIHGEDTSITDGSYITAVERQHDIAMQTGKFVRVIEYVTERPRRKKYREDE